MYTFNIWFIIKGQAAGNHVGLIANGDRNMKNNFNKTGNKFSLVYALFFLSSTFMLAVAVIFSVYINGMERETVISIQNHLLVAAQRASVYLTVDELDLFHTAEDMERPEWDETRARLQTFAEESHVLYVYYWRYLGNGQLQYIIDNDEDENYMVTPELVFAIEDDPFTEDAVYVITAGGSWVTDLGTYTDSWDGLLSAVVPVFNEDGTVYCAAGVDLSDEVIVTMRRNIRIMRFVLVFSLLISILSGFLGMRSYNKKAIQSAGANLSKSNFLSTMSHEIRTPMNAIIGMTAIGKKANNINEKDRAFNKIENASSHLLGVINEVLDMAKIEANKLDLSPVDYNFEEMVQKVIEVVSLRADEKQQLLTVDIGSAVPEYVVGDDQRLAQVMTNLLSNAVKFTPEHGKIMFSASIISVFGNECELRIEVADTGIGISREQQSKLFGMFQQAENETSRKFGGTGLGLVISKRIVELMGGNIWVESELGKGARFIFTVKILYSEQNNLSSNKNYSTDIVKTEKLNLTNSKFTGMKMLIAEDIEINREILMSLLDNSELTIDCVENGEEALTMVKKAPDKYDIILMDVQMPVMDGLEATQKIRSLPGCEPDKLPIIAMTANVFKADIEECLKAGMNNHLSKPLDINKVFEVLNKYLSSKPSDEQR